MEKPKLQREFQELHARLYLFLEMTQEAGERGMLVLVPALSILLSLVPFDADSNSHNVKKEA